MLDNSWGTLQSYVTVFTAWLFTIVNSNAWTAAVAILSFIVLVIRAYKEVRSIIKK